MVVDLAKKDHIVVTPNSDGGGRNLATVGGGIFVILYIGVFSKLANLEGCFC